ncbi:penicillin-binding protein [Streptomyces hygroscopicus]|uniref:transglycosylase domain-containing protein n=1 Tax=Streptomyces hygroscopicus TaxID=1912 RepID=UPI00223F4FD9|nr:transglycosylase domain-containing protein [Streptomyces hygroscopicus]MCW7946539.1 penicillin-binding protein [Streptomyces hygroscopicus]
MSDEPQPQQSSQGLASSPPQPAASGAAPSAASGAPSGAASGEGPERPGRTGWRRLIPTWRTVLATCVTGLLLLIGLLALGYYMVKIPAANAAATQQSNVYLYSDGSELARVGPVNRENVQLAQISKDTQHAALAAEDRDFYTESAVDPKAMVRAAWNTATGKGKQSGSTITQQYVKNYYLGQEQTVTRKVKEFFIAIKLDREKSKSDILEGYLNTSFFGRNAYGIQAAAQAYYGVDAKNLTVGQGAYLAALLNAPSEYDVIAHPENKGAALARWNYVLDGMVKKNWLSAAERQKVTFPAPRQQVAGSGLSGQRGYLVEAIKDYLTTNKIIDEDTLARGGYRITTTLQRSKQDAFVKAVNDQLTARLDKKNNKVDRYVRAGGAAVDPATGKVLAMYGGIDYTKQYVNNATRRDYQVGSTFKPFVFTSAVENGARTQDGVTITPNTMYDGTDKRPVQGWSGGPYAPENEDNKSYGPITVRQATDKSVNAVYAQMAVDVGPSKVKKTATDLGVPADTPDLQPYPSIALGTATASVLDMAQAYATLANHGKHGTYTLVEKVSKEGTQDIQLPQQGTTQAVSREAADTTTAVLQSVVDNGTATNAQAAGRPAAGKTGTAEEDQAAWFAGYTPDLATVVSVMGQDPDTGKHESLYGAMGLPRINGGGAPAQIWAQFTQAALQDQAVKDFDLSLQPGADQTVEPSTGPTDQQPGTTGTQDNGGTTGDQTTQGQDQGQTQGQANGGTAGTDGTTGTGTGGTPGTQGTTTGTTGGSTDTGGTTGTGGTAGTGGTTGDGGTTGAGGTTGTGGTTGAGGTTTGAGGTTGDGGTTGGTGA